MIELRAAPDGRGTLPDAAVHPLLVDGGIG